MEYYLEEDAERRAKDAIIIKNKSLKDDPFIEEIINVAKETFSREYCHPPDYCPAPCGNTKCDCNNTTNSDIKRTVE